MLPDVELYLNGLKYAKLYRDDQKLWSNEKFIEIIIKLSCFRFT